MQCRCYLLLLSPLFLTYCASTSNPPGPEGTRGQKAGYRSFTEPVQKAKNALSDELTHVLNSSQGAVLYSLEPDHLREDKSGYFHTIQILGQTKLDAKGAHIAADSFQKAVKDWNGSSADCFNPRHGLRLFSENHTYDFVLCYECQELLVYKDDENIASLGAGGSPTVLDNLLRVAHIPVSGNH
jgi:hypothetical protein